MKLDFLLLMLLKVTISRHKLSITVPFVARAVLCFLLYVLLYILYIRHITRKKYSTSQNNTDIDILYFDIVTMQASLICGLLSKRKITNKKFLRARISRLLGPKMLYVDVLRQKWHILTFCREKWHSFTYI